MGYDMYWREQPAEMQEEYQAAYRVFREACDARDVFPRSEMGETINREDWHREDLPLSAYVGRTERYHLAQERVREASRLMDRAQQYYFRLNTWGMRVTRDHMLELDMAYPSASEGDWPDEPPGIECPSDDIYELENAGTPRDQWPAELVAYQEAMETMLRSGVQERPGIAIHKFVPNDGWIVTPLECMGAVEQWKRAVLGPPELGTGDRRVSVLLAKATDKATTSFESEAFTAKAIELAERHDLPEWWAEWIAFLVGAAQHDGFEVF